MTDLTERAKPPMDRNPAEIEAEIERTRTQLAGTIDEIADRVHPKRVARRGADRVRGAVVDTQGKPKKVPAAVAAAGLLAVIALSIWRKRR